MKDLTLGDKTVEDAVKQYIGEARACSSTPYRGGFLGIAAMSTGFAVVVAMGESIVGDADGIEAMIAAFYDLMPSKNWLRYPKNTTPSDREIHIKLKDLRGSLVHGIGVPSDLVLLANGQSDRKSYESKWRLVVCEFVDAVDETIDYLVRCRPDLPWSPARRGATRRPVAVDDQPSAADLVIHAWNTLGVSEGSVASTGSVDYQGSSDVS